MSLHVNAAGEGRVYDFSFQKKKAAKPKAVRKPRPAPVQAPAPVETAPTVIAPVTPEPVAAAVQSAPAIQPATAVAPAPASTASSIQDVAAPVKPRLWTVSAKVAEVIDRRANDTAPLLGVQRAFAAGNALALDAQLWAPAGRMDGSFGLVFEIGTPIPRFRIAGQAGVLTTPESAARASFQSVHAYYGMGFGYALSPALTLTADVRLQDNSRYGSLAAGLAFRL